MRGGPYGEFDLPAVRAFIRVFAPRRGEIVVDAEALDLRPPKARRTDPIDRARRGGRRRTQGAGSCVADSAPRLRRPKTAPRLRRPRRPTTRTPDAP